MNLNSTAKRTTSIVLDGSSNIWKRNWPKTKDHLLLDEMKSVNLKPLTYEMLVELSGKKSKGDVERYLDQMIKDAYSRKWWITTCTTGCHPCTTRCSNSRRFIRMIRRCIGHFFYSAILSQRRYICVPYLTGFTEKFLQQFGSHIQCT